MTTQQDLDIVRTLEESKMNFKNEILKILACNDDKKKISVALVHFIVREASESTDLYSKAILDSSESFLEVLEKVAIL